MGKFTIKRKVVVEQEVSYQKYSAIKIQELRKSRKMSQQGFGDLIGLTRASIVNIEKGRQALSMKNLYLICEAFNVQSKDILPF